MRQLTTHELQLVKEYQPVEYILPDGTEVRGTQRTRQMFQIGRQEELVRRLEFAKKLAIKQEASLKPFYRKIA